MSDNPWAIDAYASAEPNLIDADASEVNEELIEKMQTCVNILRARNEEGKRNYDQLRRMAQQGEAAKMLLDRVHRSQQGLLVNHAADIWSSISNPQNLLVQNTSPETSARIEGVPSPDRRGDTRHSISPSQPTNNHPPPPHRVYGGNSQSSYLVPVQSNHQPHHHPAPTTYFRTASTSSQNAGQSSLTGALGSQMQSHEAQHYPSTAANQSGPSQTAAQQRETYPQQVFQPEGRKQTYSQQQRDLFMSGTISQPNFQPQSEHSQREIRLDPQQRESQSFGAQSHQRQPSASAVLTQSNYTPQAPSQYQGGTHSQSNSRPQTQSQQRETQPSAPMHSNLDSQAHQQIQLSAAPTQSNSRPQQLSQLTPHSSLPHAQLQQRDSQLSAPTHSNSRPQVQRTSQPSTSANANPQAQPPNQPNLQPQLPSQQNSASQPQSQQRPTQASAPPTHANSVPQGPTQTSQGNSRPQGQPQHREAQPPVTATQSNSRPLAQSQAAPTQPHNPSFPSATVPATAAPAPSRSYGPSPFAHVPAATAGQSHQQANFSAVPNHNTTGPTVPNGRSVQHAGFRPAPAQGSSTDSRAPGPSELPSLSNAHYVLFLAVIVSWQLSCPPVSFMEIPPARIKVIKAPDGLHYMQAHAQTGEMMEITAPSAFVIAQHFLAGKRASLYSNAKGIVQLVAEPLTAAQKMTHKFYVTKVAATALLEDKTGHGAAALAAAAAPAPSLALAGTTKRPPPDDSATRQRGPQDADRRFVARDLLWQLTPLPRYAPDEDVLRYAKRRAIEAPEPVSRTWTAAAVAAAARRVEVGSSESSAKTTPEPPTRTPSVAPSPPPPPPPQEQEQKKQRVPLFLPDGSPPPMTFGKAERLMAPVEGRGSSRRQASGSRASSPTCYVLVPEAPEYVRRHQARVRKQKQTRLEAIQAAAAEEAAELEIDERELMRRRALGMYRNTESEVEAAAMKEACSRMRESPCKWFLCESVLNSPENLLAHVHESHSREDELATCLWDICGQSFMDWKQLSLHAETHIVNTVYCAHQDCDALLRSPAELVEHNRGHTEENSALRPSACPSAPQEPLVLPPVPGTLPVYEVLAPPVGMPSIAPERHMALGPWVLRNICAPVNVRAGKRYNAAIPLRADGAKAAAAAAYQPDYEFLETSSMHYSCLPSRPARVREVADLKSKEVSDLVARGQLVLWPGPVAVAASVSGGTAAEEEELAVESMLQGEAESDSTRLGVE